MAEPELKVLDLATGFLGEDTRQNRDIVQVQRIVEELLD
jgi:hypothetical protein